MDLINIFRYIFLILFNCGVDPVSASYCSYYDYYYYSILYYCPTYYSSYYYYYYYGSSSAGTIAGAVVGSIIGVAILIAIIIAVLCGACKTINRRGVVVQPIQTTATVVATNSSQMQYQPMYNQYNQYPPPPGGAAYPPPAYPAPAPVESQESAFHSQPPTYRV